MVLKYKTNKINSLFCKFSLTLFHHFQVVNKDIITKFRFDEKYLSYSRNHDQELGENVYCKMSQI